MTPHQPKNPSKTVWQKRDQWSAGFSINPFNWNWYFANMKYIGMLMAHIGPFVFMIDYGAPEL